MRALHCQRISNLLKTDSIRFRWLSSFINHHAVAVPTDRHSWPCQPGRGGVEEEEELLVVHHGHGGGHRGSADSNSVEFNSRASSITTDSFCERGGVGPGGESEESLQQRLR